MALFTFSSSYTPKQFSLLGIALCLTPLTFAADLQPAIKAFNEMQHAKAKPLFQAVVYDAAVKHEAL